MNRTQRSLAFAAALALLLPIAAANAAAPDWSNGKVVTLDVKLKGDLTPGHLKQLERIGDVTATQPKNDSVKLKVKPSDVKQVKELPFVEAAKVSGGGSAQTMVGINVVLKQDINAALLKELGKYGRVLNTYEQIDALTMKVRQGDLESIQRLPFVAAANEDATRETGPVPSVISDTTGGMSTWNLDLIDITSEPGSGKREVDQDGSGVYVAVLDTGLLKTWRAYFPTERIATQFGAAFGGGGGEVGNVSRQPNKWETDQDSHGTHVTSTIIGYKAGANVIQGVAPMAEIIPVKVLNQNGSGWSSVVAAGITYVADLKASGELGSRPVVINMSLGGSRLDAMEKAAIDYAIQEGVIIVASAGNSGLRGMGYPGAYTPVISVAAAGWGGEWSDWDARPLTWWYDSDVDEEEPGIYITDFSSRALPDKLVDGKPQDLDIAAPGSWILGPYQTNGQLSWYFLGGTSMASPHIAGVVALMAQCRSTLSPTEAETTLESTARPINHDSLEVRGPNGVLKTVTWGPNATGSGLVNVPAVLNAVCSGS